MQELRKITDALRIILIPILILLLLFSLAKLIASENPANILTWGFLTLTWIGLLLLLKPSKGLDRPAP